MRRKSRLIVKKRARPGTAPGVLVADPTAAATQISVVAYGPDETAHGFAERQGARLEAIQAMRERAAVLWVDIAGLADQETIQALAAGFGLHPLVVEDVTNTHQRPKAEPYDDHLYIVFRLLAPGGPVEGEQVSVVIGKDYVLTFQERREPAAATDCFEPVRERLRRGKGRFRRLGADYLAYALIDAAIDSYFPALESLGETLEALEDAVVARPERALIEKLHHVKRELLTLRRAIWPAREMLNALLREEMPEITATTRPYLRDTYDHTVQLMDIVETYREIASGLLDIYLSSQSTRLNEVMKVLTVIATIFMPLGFVASLYGMNFDTGSPWNMPELGWRFGYPLALALMLAIALGLLWYFRRKGWLKGEE